MHLFPAPWQWIRIFYRSFYSSNKIRKWDTHDEETTMILQCTKIHRLILNSQIVGKQSGCTFLLNVPLLPRRRRISINQPSRCDNSIIRNCTKPWSKRSSARIWKNIPHKYTILEVFYISSQTPYPNLDRCGQAISITNLPSDGSGKNYCYGTCLTVQ